MKASCFDGSESRNVEEKYLTWSIGEPFCENLVKCLNLKFERGERCVIAGGISVKARQYLCSSEPALNTGGLEEEQRQFRGQQRHCKANSCIEAGNRAIVRAPGTFIRVKHTIK